MYNFLGEIKCFSFDFTPRGWAKCDGQLLNISENQALFSLIGSDYGGDGRTTFALPDLRGRTAIHGGVGDGLTNRKIGEKGGTENFTLSVAQIPQHNHSLKISNGVSDSFTADGKGIANVPVNREEGQANELLEIFKDAPEYTTKFLHEETIGNTGGGQPLNIMQPYLTINYCIALEGLYPPR